VEGFEELNRRLAKEGKELFANPRNAASGSLRQLDSKITASRPLDIFFYDILALEDGDRFRFTEHWEILNTLPEWGLKVNENIRKCSHIAQAIQFHDELEQRREKLGYEIDGVVIKVNNLQQREKLGYRSRSPRWAIAYKFTPRQGVTKIEDIVVQVGRTGALTPVALLRPVDVGGVTISRATLHNMDNVDRLGVKIGDTVRVERAGDVIPEVVEVEQDARTGQEKVFEMPQACPACGSPVIREGAYHLCSGGLSCPAQLKESIKHYASKHAMDIDGLGDKIVERLVDEGLIKGIDGLYDLRAEDLLALEGFADKSAQNMIQAISATKERSLARFIYALGIRHVGRHLAEVLAEQFDSVEELARADMEALQQIKEVGPQVAQSIVNFFQNQKNLELIRRLAQKGIRPQKPKPSVQNIFQGKRFVFTGSLTSFTRSQAQALVESLGGRATSTVSRQTDFVVAGENPGSKLEEAKKHGVRIISEAEFVKMIKQAGYHPDAFSP